MLKGDYGEFASGGKITYDEAWRFWMHRDADWGMCMCEMPCGVEKLTDSAVVDAIVSGIEDVLREVRDAEHHY